MQEILKARENQIIQKGLSTHTLKCDRRSVSGSVSQRACAFCGSRVVLYPISDALHLIHGPIGCAAYTWDIRGSLSSGPQLHRLSFSTDLQEKDVIFGGEPKLYNALNELIDKYAPKAAFVYSTCIVGLIGDDVQAICKRVSKERNLDVIMVESEGFRGTKKTGYQAACDALYQLVGTADLVPTPDYSINILGDFNIAGESWLIKEYFEAMGVNVIATMTGDGRVDEIRRSHKAQLNLVQCSGSMTHLAKSMKRDFGIPFKRVSFSGIEDTSAALYETAEFFNNEAMMDKARILVAGRLKKILPELQKLKADLTGKRAALYVGGAFKAFSLVRALRMLGMETVLAGTQTGSAEDYDLLRDICHEGTVIVDDSNPLELSRFCLEKDVDLFIGGVKERPIAYKLGIAFCDHNHERKICLAGFEGMLNFAREVHRSVMSPVWDFVPRREQSRVIERSTRDDHNA